MGVDFNGCEYCGEAYIDDVCYSRSIDLQEMYICDRCIERELEDGKLIRFDDEDDDGYELLTEKEKELIEYYGKIYKRMKIGIEERIEEIDKLVKDLNKEKEELLFRLKSEY